MWQQTQHKVGVWGGCRSRHNTTCAVPGLCTCMPCSASKLAHNQTPNGWGALLALSVVATHTCPESCAITLHRNTSQLLACKHSQKHSETGRSAGRHQRALLEGHHNSQPTESQRQGRPATPGGHGKPCACQGQHRSQRPPLACKRLHAYAGRGAVKGCRQQTQSMPAARSSRPRRSWSSFSEILTDEGGGQRYYISNDLAAQHQPEFPPTAAKI